jgi:hypothetical protein
MRIAKMKIVFMCMAAAGFLFFTGCEDEQKPDTPFSVCDFTFKGKSYHFVSDLTYYDPVQILSSAYGAFWSFDFRSSAGLSTYDNRVWITYDPDSLQNRDKPMVGPHPIDSLTLTIEGVEYGTTANKGTITITRWESHVGLDDAEYTRSICEGYFSGTIVESNGSEYPIEGTFEGTIDDVN